MYRYLECTVKLRHMVKMASYLRIFAKMNMLKRYTFRIELEL